MSDSKQHDFNRRLPPAKPNPPMKQGGIAGNPPQPPTAKPAPPQKPVKIKDANMIPIQQAIDISVGVSESSLPNETIDGGTATTSHKHESTAPLLSPSSPRSEQLANLQVASPSPLQGGGISSGRRSPLPSDHSDGSVVGYNRDMSNYGSEKRRDEKALIMRNMAASAAAVSGHSNCDDDSQSSERSTSGRGAGLRETFASVRESSSKSVSSQRQQHVVGVVLPVSGQYVKGQLASGEPDNPIYHLVRFSDFWMVMLMLIHIGQFTLLLTVGYNALPGAAFGLVLVLVLAVPVLLVISRLLVKKNHMSSKKNIKLRGDVCTPSDEADDIPDASVYCIGAAAIVEGIAFAVYAAVTSGNDSHLSNNGFYTKGTLLQTLRFVSITLLSLHRTLRPANRLDPLRTILELELVAVCWDALDGSTLYELLDYDDLSNPTQVAIRLLMAFWYTSVGFRMALMFATNLGPTSPIQRFFITGPYQLAPQPTVDRTLQGLRLRSIVTMAMAVADLYAAILRLVLWIQGQLDPLQQDMCLKNILFLFTVGFAYNNYLNTVKREWNKRELPFGFTRPSRDAQLAWLRWGFAASYLTVSALFTAILVQVTSAGTKWIGNFILDAFFVIVFLAYCWNAHVHMPSLEPSTIFLPKKGFFEFPGRMAVAISVLLFCSLLIGRITAIYYHYSALHREGDDSTGSLYTYDTAVLVVILSVVPIAALGNFWTLAFMLFKREFTASPGNYNAIHDPSIKLVALSTMVEGALDVLSCATLMQLAENELPAAVNGAVVLFSLLEMLNACQSFGLQALLSGGHDDTQLDLVRWNALLRTSRGAIDFGTIILRLVLWVKYNSISSVFLVKNLYNLIHTFSQVERYKGTIYYPKGTLFSEFVPPQDWYGLSKEQWREATRTTVLAQARAGRGV